MRRLLGLTILLLVLGSIPAVAGPTCTIRGTRGDDVLQGTAAADVICGLAGNDYANGQRGNDTVIGGRGNDLLVGGAGIDRLRGRRGNDRLLAVDGAPLDQLNGGVGNDTCHVDIGDGFINCEHIDLARPLLTQRMMVVQFSPQLVTWLHDHGYDEEGGK